MNNLILKAQQGTVAEQNKKALQASKYYQQQASLQSALRDKQGRQFKLFSNDANDLSGLQSRMAEQSDVRSFSQEYNNNGTNYARNSYLITTPQGDSIWNHNINVNGRERNLDAIYNADTKKYSYFTSGYEGNKEVYDVDELPNRIRAILNGAVKFDKGGLVPKSKFSILKAQKGKRVKRIDFEGLRKDPRYKEFNWYMHPNLELIQDSLNARGADFPEQVAVFSQVIPESGGDTKPHGNGAEGYVGWRGPRKENLPKDAPGQAHKLMSEIYDNPTAKDWTHGGKGTNVQTAGEMRELFLNTPNVTQAVKAFMKGYVRPESREWDKRLKFAELLKKYWK